ncbi:MAG: hypothetical protein ACRD2M_07645 [Terriglobales bacterium]
MDSTTSDLEACLVKLGEQRYLDVYSRPKDDFDAAQAHHIPAHSFWKLSLEGDQMRLTQPDFTWLHELLQKDPKAVRATLADKDLILLTAPTEELQQFVRRHGDQLFNGEGESVFQRQPAAEK